MKRIGQKSRGKTECGILKPSEESMSRRVKSSVLNVSGKSSDMNSEIYD